MTKRYDEEFRREAVRLAVSGEKSIVKTAKDLGIKEATLYYWVQEAKCAQGKLEIDDKKLSPSELIDELMRLKKENARLREEREILKKAAAFFAKEELKR
jgi:transposase